MVRQSAHWRSVLVKPVRHLLDWHLLALAALVLADVFLSGPRGALAHARLVRSTPASQARLATPPERVELWFSELLESRFNSVEVVPAAEVTAKLRPNLARGAPTVDRDDRTRMMVPVQELGPGDYAVEWRVLSRDGHTAAGRFTFRVQAAR
jgi:copper resistance protein C